MKTRIHWVVAFVVALFSGSDLMAQYGYGYGSGYGYGYGRYRNNIPSVEQEPKKPEPMTASEIVDAEMPEIAEALELNDFETAVLSATLKKYVQQRIEMQILELTPDQMRAGMERITQEQDKELQVGLPQDKYEAFVALQKQGVKKTQKDKKKEKKKKQKKKN